MKRFFYWLNSQFVWLTDKEVLQMVNDGVDHKTICKLVWIKAHGHTVKIDLNILNDDFESVYVSPKVIKFLRWVRDHADMEIEDFCWFGEKVCIECGYTLD